MGVKFNLSHAGFHSRSTCDAHSVCINEYCILLTIMTVVLLQFHIYHFSYRRHCLLV